MSQGRLQKARRGDLAFALPIGYVLRPSGQIALDPDEQVQAVVRLIFRKFEELGTTNAVLRYLVRSSVQLGVRVRTGPGKGQLEWRRPNRATLQGLLHHPMYAGAYVYGRRKTDPRRKKPGQRGSGRVMMGPEEWCVLLKDRVPAYIPWEEYEENLARLRSNRTRAEERGAVRRGAALLSGLAVCAKCGGRMSPHYRASDGYHAYVCNRMLLHYGGEPCQRLSGPALDRFVSDQALRALAPASLELSLEAAKNLQEERGRLEALWQQRLERAAYEADRAARQYRLVEPENRLVSRTLEREWEEKLAESQRLQEEHRRFEREQPRVLSEAERESIRCLAADIPGLWDAATTATEDRKEILRQIIERVVVDVQGETERVRVLIEWAGGAKTEHEMFRPLQCLRQLSYYSEMCRELRSLAAQGIQPDEIAERFNQRGFRPPKNTERYDREGIQKLMREIGLVGSRSRSRAREGLAQDEWWLPALATEIPIPRMTLISWVERGWIKARREGSRWVLRADAAEIERLREMRRRPPGFHVRQYWVGKANAEAEMKMTRAMTD